MDFLAPIQNSILSLDLVLRTNHSIPEIPHLLNRTVLVGGKRLRPALCFLIGQSLGVSAEQMFPFARAAEFTHSASLAHDDVVDSAVLRRYQKTINAESSNKKAVLAGDLLLARVMVELSQQGDIEIIHDLSLVVEDLVNGEWIQMALRGSVDTTSDQLIEVSKRKTASLMSWCCKVAAKISPVTNPDVIFHSTQFGENLGIAFQMMDDVIDFKSMGEKDYAKDVKEGLINYVMADLLVRKPQMKPLVFEILGKPETNQWPWTDEDLVVSVENVRTHATQFLNSAKEHLQKLREMTHPQDASCLQGFASLEGLVDYMTMRQN